MSQKARVGLKSRLFLSFFFVCAMVLSPVFYFSARSHAATQTAGEQPADAFNRKADKLLKHIYHTATQSGKSNVSMESNASSAKAARLAKITRVRERYDGLTHVGVTAKLVEGTDEEVEAIKAAGFTVGARIGDIATVETTPERLPALAALSSVRSIHAARILHKLNDRARQAVGVDNASGQRVVSQTGKGVVIGMIDTGIDWKHGDFIIPGTRRTRIKALWDQFDPRNDYTLPGTNLAEGHLYTEADINNALANNNSSSIVAEQDTDGHGSHVTGSAAGNGTGGTAPAGLYAGIAPEADLVIVKSDNGQGIDTNDEINAIEFIRQQAAALNEPFVINMSFGSQLGSHDGTSPDEQAIDALVRGGVGRAVCAAAGNEGADSIHALATVPAGGSLALTFVEHNDSFANAIDIYAQSPNDHYLVTVTAPDGTKLGPVAYDPNGFNFSNGQASNRYITIYNALDDKGDNDPSNDQPDIFLVFNNDATGTWTITLQDADSNPNAPLDAWFDGEDVQFTNNVDNNSHLVSSPGTARGAITVGAYVTRSATQTIGATAYFSSPGPTADGRLKPEVTAPGYYLYSTRSSDAADPTIYTYGTGANAIANNDTTHYGGLAGTSISTPVVTGSVALMLQANPRLSATQLRDFITRYATKDSFTTNARWTPLYGFGKLNIATPLAAITGAIANPIDDTNFYVTQQYNDFLNRDPDSAGLQFWTSQISSCGGDANCIDIKRQNVSAAYFLSREFQETGFYVIKLQRAAFGRVSNNASSRITYAQFTADAQAVGNGFVDGQAGADQVLDQNKTAYAQKVAASPLFVAKYPISMTAAQFVSALYQTAGVQPTAQEQQDAITAFGSGGTAGRAAALRKVAESNSVKQAEFNAAFVLLQYFGYLRRNPTDAPDTSDAGYQFWLGKLNQFNGDYIASQMVRSFIVSQEYRQRFGKP
jgi:subtilisin family serine protease